MQIYIDNERSGEKEGDDVTNILAMVATEVKRGFDGLFDDKEKNIERIWVTMNLELKGPTSHETRALKVTKLKKLPKVVSKRELVHLSWVSCLSECLQPKNPTFSSLPLLWKICSNQIRHRIEL